MRAIAATISSPDLSGIVVSGAAGVGKSRIAREALSSAACRGFGTRWAIGTSSARALPLGAFASWMDSDATDSLELVRGVIAALTSASPGTRVVVGVDDVHLLDDLSTFVLHQIVQRRAAKVVLTVRSGEPISAGTREIWNVGELDRLDLQPLSRDESTTLVSTTLGGLLDPIAANRLWELTRGNVLYLRNIVEQEVADGRLVEQHGHWRWIGDPVVPPGLAELIESRIGSLSKPVGDVIDALAVGEPIELRSLGRIGNPKAIEEADTRGLITLEQGEYGVEARLAHPLYGELRRKRAPATRLRRLRGLVSKELGESNYCNDIRVVVRRAALSLDSDLAPDADLLVSAAHGAVWLADLPLADRLAEAAIRAAGKPEASFVRAHTLMWLNRGQEAEGLLANARVSEFTEDDHASLAFLRAMNRLFALADPMGAKDFIDDLSRTEPSGVRPSIHAFVTLYWASMGKPDRAITSSKNFALDRLPPIVGAPTAWAIAVASADAGRITDAVTAAHAGYTIAPRSFRAHMRFANADAHVGALLLAGRIGEAVEVAERERQQAADLPGPTQLLIIAMAGRALLGAGRLDIASPLLEPVVEALSTEGDDSGWRYRFQIPRVIALAMRGLTDEATAALAALEDGRHPSWRFLDYEHAIARAWVIAAQGAITEATRTVLLAAETARASGQFAAEVLCLQMAAQFGDVSVATRLRELEAIVEGPRVSLAARFAAALHKGDAVELTAVSQDFERVGDLVAAIDAAAHAALAYRSKDLRGSVLACSSRAGALAEQCGSASTPALRKVSLPLPLTDREREIVMLLGQGLSTAAIAERLTVSVRTVEGHIYRAMAKTGMSRRDDLAALLVRHEPRLHK
jgi:DNA-binding CsgD family transcriptional regulator